MRIIHFFKAKSRIGIINSSSARWNDSSIGVENGSDAILTDDFLEKFTPHYISEYVFPKPEQISHKQFNKILRKHISDFREFINKCLGPSQTQVVIGGDHSITLASILAVRDRVGDFKKLGYVQFDSHGDMNLNASSPTGNFHGMYVCPLVDHFDIQEIEELVPNKLPVTNMVYIGNLNLDHEEADLFRKKKIKNINRETLLGDKNSVIKNFKNFITSFQYLHATFDIDVLDKTQAFATGIPSENGLMLEDIEELLRIIGKHPNLSFDLAELSPQKSGLEQTVQSIHKILLTSLLL